MYITKIATRRKDYVEYKKYDANKLEAEQVGHCFFVELYAILELSKSPNK